MSRGTFVERKVHLGILAVVVLGAAVAVALGLGISEWGMQVRAQLTACGFDSQGAYAKIRLNNPQDTYDQRTVWVNFSATGSSSYPPYAVGAAGVLAPAHGYRTVVVHVGFPPRRSHIEGRTVYVLGRPHENPRFVTKKVAFRHHSLQHPRGLYIETVPDDPSILHCWIERNPDPD